MTRRRLQLLVTAVLVAGGVVAGYAARRRRRHAPADVFTDGPSPPVVAGRERDGGPQQRGLVHTYGLDIDRLKEETGFEPVVQYLTYIQSQRGSGSHLLFVRYDDLDAMAAIDGEPTPAFLERLEQLGVVVSNN
jgi:hypothetical protein